MHLCSNARNTLVSGVVWLQLHSRDVARIFGLGGLIWANFGWRLSTKISLAAAFFSWSNTITHYFFWDKSSKKHKPKPKRANGLHFVLGGLYFYLGVLSPLPPSPCLAIHVPASQIHNGILILELLLFEA